ncbi:MAG: hypothetical protein L0H63_04990 [Nitrococcus sp.]|nr:hypothetical protein [Nitrococcus sp.]
MEKTEKQAQWRTLSGICLIAAALFLITAFVLDFGTGIDVVKHLPGNGGKIGPLRIEEPYTVLEINVYQPVSDNHWSFVTGALLDANGSYLTGFGDELWHESGYDDGGRWAETDYSYDTKLTVREPGTYYLRFTTESDANPAKLISITVGVKEVFASSLPHLLAGIVLILIGIVINLRSGGTLRRVFQEAS